MDFDFDSILDKSIDDLADLPSFAVPDTGMYRLSVEMEAKEINKKPAVSANITVRELIELADSSIPEESRAKPGDKFNLLFVLKNDDGEDLEISWGRLKEFCKPFEAHFGEKNLRVLLKEKMNTPVDFTAKVVKKARKDDKDKFDARIEEIVVD